MLAVWHQVKVGWGMPSKLGRQQLPVSVPRFQSEDKPVIGPKWWNNYFSWNLYSNGSTKIRHYGIVLQDSHAHPWCLIFLWPPLLCSLGDIGCSRKWSFSSKSCYCARAPAFTRGTTIDQRVPPLRSDILLDRLDPETKIFRVHPTKQGSLWNLGNNQL